MISNLRKIQLHSLIRTNKLLLILCCVLLPIMVEASKLSQNFVSKDVKGQRSNISYLRLDLATARLLTKTDKSEEAIELLNTLNNIYPNNYRVNASMADTQLTIGNWRKALEHIEKAYEINPQDKSLLAIKESILKNHKPELSASYRFESRGNTATQRIVETKYEHEIKPFTKLGFILDHNDLDIHQIFRTMDGNLQQAKTNRYKSELYIEHHNADSNTTKLSLYLGDNIIGIGGDYRLKQHVSIHAEFQRPYWGFLEGVVDNGTRDQIKISYGKNPTPNTYFYIEGAINRYGINQKQNMASSRSFSLYSHYKIPKTNLVGKWFNDKEYLSFVYAIDGEYSSQQKQKISVSTGTNFSPIPLNTRELHVIEIQTRKYLNDAIYFDGSFGRIIDRFADDAPTFGANITYLFNKNTSLRIHGRRSVSTDNSSEIVNIMGIQFVKKL